MFDILFTTDAVTALRAFATASGLWGAPIPATLREMALEGKGCPQTWDGLDALLDEADKRTGDPNASQVGLVYPGKEDRGTGWYPEATESVGILIWGTGRSTVHLMVRTTGFALWAETTAGQRIRSPQELEHAAVSLSRRWEVLREELAVSGPPVDVTVEVVRRVEVDTDEA